MHSPGLRALLAALLSAVLIGGAWVGMRAASSDEASGERSEQPSLEAQTAVEAEADRHAAAEADAPDDLPLRKGERRVTLSMPEPYTPDPPSGASSDDYRCFLLDPGLDEEVFVTGTDVSPGNPRLVHHVILFDVPAEQVEEAEQLDKVTDGQGWTCFGDSGLRTGPGSLDDAPWLGAWAPGVAESVMRAGYGKPLEPGSRIVMQVHYSLLAGEGADISSTRLRVAPATRDLAPIRTMLMPAPVELPCRPDRADGPLCDRDAALADVEERVGYAGGANWLHILCGTQIEPDPTTRCDRRISEPSTLLGVAGHMHLLGKQIRIDLNPGRPDARRVLDIEEWDFDNQGSRGVDPVRLEPGDTVRVTCRHSQEARDQVTAFEGEGRLDRYVVWGEGTVDEMCLGILQVAPTG